MSPVPARKDALWGYTGTQRPLSAHRTQWRSHGLAAAYSSAVVHAGSWRVYCPSCPPEALPWPVSEGQERFVCPLCGNAAANRRPILIRWPDERTRTAVMAVLTVRPDPATRFWYPGETVDELRRENREHGLPGLIVIGEV